MRRQNDLWQGCAGYWQNRFVHHHILTIGYLAWKGYMNQGRGMVVCDVVEAIPPTIDWSVDPVMFKPDFIPQAAVAMFLQTFELEQAAVTALLSAIATYDPTQAIVILVIGNSTIDVNLLQNLAISPANCYEQVQRRWTEFQPALTTRRRCP